VYKDLVVSSFRRGPDGPVPGTGAVAPAGCRWKRFRFATAAVGRSSSWVKSWISGESASQSLTARLRPWREPLGSIRLPAVVC